MQQRGYGLNEANSRWNELPEIQKAKYRIMAEDDRKRYFKEMETWRIQHILGNFIKSFNSVGGLTLVLNRRGEIRK